MSRIFITGSSDGLGKMAARLLLADGHRVVLHARNKERAAQAAAALPDAEDVLVGDLASLAQTRALASKANDLGTFDAVIHNAAVGYKEPRCLVTEDGLPHVFAVNSLAPYVLTALMHRPKRLVYISSRLHLNGNPSLRDLHWNSRLWDGTQAYSDSKLHNVLLAFAMARLWPATHANALEPGWVATKMGGAEAPDDLELAPKTQVWLASSDAPEATGSGNYFYHQKPSRVHERAHDVELQMQFLAECARLSKTALPI